MDRKNKKADDLIKVFGYEIKNQLEQFVSDVGPSEIDGGKEDVTGQSERVAPFGKM